MSLVNSDVREPGDPKAAFHGRFGSTQGYPEVRNAVMATTTVEWLSSFSSPKWKIAGVLSHHDRVQESQQFTGTPMYIIYAHKANSELLWSSTRMGRALKALCGVSIPNNVRELCHDCFQGSASLRRVIFGSSSSLQKIGVSCFEGTAIEEVTIPDGVGQLCDGCFMGCANLRRVTFGSSSSLGWIGVSCFLGTAIEEITIPDSVRALGEWCFQGCERLHSVTFGPSSSLGRIGVSCFLRSEELRVWKDCRVSVLEGWGGWG